MFSPTDRPTPRRTLNPQSRGNLQEILESLDLVLEMGPDHLDGAIDLMEEAIQSDRRKSPADRPRPTS